MIAPEKILIRVLLANDHELICLGLKALLQAEADVKLVGGAGDFEEALRLTKTLSPDVILLDFMMQDGNSAERIPELLSVCPACKILMFTSCHNLENHLLALRQGASGILTIDQPGYMLLKAIRSVYMGEVWVSNSLTHEMLRCFNHSQTLARTINTLPGNSLTRREAAVARLAVQGFAAKKIAMQLCISEKTVRNRLVIVYSKLGVTGQIELVLHAKQLGLLAPEQ